VEEKLSGRSPQVNERFGLSLLHKHFGLSEEEIIVRKVNVKRRIVDMSPKKNQNTAIPYLWKAAPGDRTRWQFFPLEFLGSHQRKKLTSKTMGKLAPFFCDVAQALADLDLLDVFGIGTTNIRDIPISEHEMIIETTDEERRRLTVKPYLRSDVKMEELTETFWLFTPDEGSNDPEAALECKGQHCNRHCNSHCRGHCTGHCIDHNPKPE